MKLGRNNQQILSDDELHDVYEKFKKKKESLTNPHLKKYHKRSGNDLQSKKLNKQCHKTKNPTLPTNDENTHHRKILDKIIENLNEEKPLRPSTNSPMSSNRSSLNEYHHNAAKFHYIKSRNENSARRSADKKHLPQNFQSPKLRYEIDMGNILKSIDDNYNKYKSSFGKTANHFNFVRNVEENNRINLEKVDANLIAENAANRIVDKFIIKHPPTNPLSELNIEPLNLSQIFDESIANVEETPVKHLLKSPTDKREKVDSPYINTERTFSSNKIINDHVDWRTRRIRRERTACSFRTLSALSRESSFLYGKDDVLGVTAEKLKYTTPIFGEKGTKPKRSHSVRISDRLEIISSKEPTPSDSVIAVPNWIGEFIAQVIEKGRNQWEMEQLRKNGPLLKFDDGKIMELSKGKSKLFLNKSYTLQANQEMTNQRGILRKPPPLFVKNNNKNNEKRVLESHLALLPISSSTSLGRKSNSRYKLGRNGRPAPAKPFSETYLWKSWQYLSMSKAQQLNLERGRVINDERNDNISIDSDEKELRNVIDKVNLTSQDYHMMETIRVNNNYTVFDYVMKERLDGIKRPIARPVKLPKIMKLNEGKTMSPIPKLYNTPVASELCLRKSLKSNSSISVENGTHGP